MHDQLIELMTNLSEEIKGYYFQNEDLGQFGVIKENSVFLYRFPSRDYIAAFSIMTAIPNLPEVEIYMDRPNIVNIVKPYYKDETFDVTISGDDKQHGTALVDSLLSDYQFMANFKRLFKKDYRIVIKNKTISVYDYRNINGLFSDTVKVEDLIQMYNVLKELQLSIEYFIKKYNPL